MDIKCRKDLATLVGDVGCELGVWKGSFSDVLISNSQCKILYSVDCWCDDTRGHNDSEYEIAFNLLSKHGDRSKIVRKSFSDALLDFDDNYFDFIYIDGYAHTGQDEGETINMWWDKLKPGGCYSGHDYSENEYPKTYKYVNEFIERHNLILHTTNGLDRIPSWYTFKPSL